MKIVLMLGIFCLLQVICLVLFKTGSNSPQLWLPCFIVANIIGGSSTWVLMMVYRVLPVNIATGLGMGLSFMLGQIVLALVFRTSLASLQIIGIVAMTVGIILLCFGARPA